MDMRRPMVIRIDYNPEPVEPRNRRHDFNYTQIPKRLGFDDVLRDRTVYGPIAHQPVRYPFRC